jgi:formylmethanofuran dehydrogenase subunit E
MGLGRVLIIVALVWVAVRLYRRYRAGTTRRATTAQVKLIRCAKCGVYLPEQDAKVGADNAPVCAHHQTGN